MEHLTIRLILSFFSITYTVLKSFSCTSVIIYANQRNNKLIISGCIIKLIAICVYLRTAAGTFGSLSNAWPTKKDGVFSDDLE